MLRGKNKRSPYLEQESEELGDEVIARMNPKTGEIENLGTMGSADPPKVSFVLLPHSLPAALTLSSKSAK